MPEPAVDIQQYNQYKDWSNRDPRTFIQLKKSGQGESEGCHELLVNRDAEGKWLGATEGKWPGATVYSEHRLDPRTLLDKDMIYDGWTRQKGTDARRPTNPSKIDVTNCKVPPLQIEPTPLFPTTKKKCKEKCDRDEECIGFSTFDGPGVFRGTYLPEGAVANCALLGHGVLGKNPGFIAGKMEKGASTYVKSKQNKTCRGIHYENGWDLRDCVDEKGVEKQNQAVAAKIEPLRIFVGNEWGSMPGNRV